MKILQSILPVLLLVFASTSAANAMTYSFSDKDFLDGESWGTMTIDVFDADTLKIKYEASSATVIPGLSEATGFGFAFIPNTIIPSSITNPGNSDDAGDQDGLTWAILSNVNSIPTPTNEDEFGFSGPNHAQFFFGATEPQHGGANGFSPPGIAPGEYDIFYLNFAGTNFTSASFKLGDFVELAGVRLQSLPGEINGGSLFLLGGEAGAPPEEVVPEPGTFILMGVGLAALGLYRRTRRG